MSECWERGLRTGSFVHTRCTVPYYEADPAARAFAFLLRGDPSNVLTSAREYIFSRSQSLQRTMNECGGFVASDSRWFWRRATLAGTAIGSLHQIQATPR